MPPVDALAIFHSQELKFPNGETVEDYVRELPAAALSRLEYMKFSQERGTMIRYLEMHNKFYANEIRDLSAETFASTSHVKKFAKEYAEGDDTEDTVPMRDSISRAILQFLFVYYYSYQEAEELSGNKIKIVSFCAWFYRLRSAMGRKMRREMEAREKSYNALTGRQREQHVRRMKRGRSTWKGNWSTTHRVKLRSMIHVINVPNASSMNWWTFFKIHSNRVQATGAHTVRHEVLRKFRTWSIFFHTDRRNNQRLGGPFANRLADRFLELMNKKQEMLTWYSDLAVDVADD